jgi:serine/threonine protein kinase
MSYSDYEIVRQLSSGGYSDTFVVSKKKTFEIAVMKVVSVAFYLMLSKY